MTENEAISIDEAIKHTREVANDKRADADWKWRHGRLNSDDCISCAEQHEQLAEWLEELKAYRAIGTVEEFKTLKEKNVAKSRIIKDGKYYCCSCNRFAKTSGHCSHCGQMLY